MAELIDQHWQSAAPRMTIREALQQRIAAGDERAVEALHVLETWAPERLEGFIGRTVRGE
jgi:hypothetical protein